MYPREKETWLNRRLVVWCALSELFLDTELQSDDLKVIARRIREARFTANEAETILLREVAPVFVSNLVSPAGEWTGWSDDIVRDAVLGHLRKGLFRKWLARVGARAGKRLYMSQWTKVAQYLD